jgi:hypothetical protein
MPTSQFSTRAFVALTGGPGGGKTALVRALAKDPAWRGHFLALPEAISVVGPMGIPPCEQLFQRLMVWMQRGMEEAAARALGPQDRCPILCHRGSLDPLAYWLQRGWPEEQFYSYTDTSREEHYRRYVGVIHLVTAADGAPSEYHHWPEADRGETPEEAILIDQLLEQVWCGHPRYVRIDNAARDWPAKLVVAKEVLAGMIQKSV